jgi:hypothetical protein
MGLKASIRVWRTPMPLEMTRRRRVQAKVVLLALADVADNDGANAWPSVATLGRLGAPLRK